METPAVRADDESNFHRSEWRSSLKGMETYRIQPPCSLILEMVRMEVFPERDGNWQTLYWYLPATLSLSEWRSSLKGMETAALYTGPKRSDALVRMEVFPERDGNFSIFLN